MVIVLPRDPLGMPTAEHPATEATENNSPRESETSDWTPQDDERDGRKGGSIKDVYEGRVFRTGVVGTGQR